MLGWSRARCSRGEGQEEAEGARRGDEPQPGASSCPGVRRVDSPPAATDTWVPALVGATNPLFASHSEGDIQIIARWQPMRGEGAGPRPPPFPRRASLTGGSSASGEVLGAIGKLRYWGHWEALGAFSMTGSTHACQRPWGSQYYPGSRPQRMEGAKICPSGSGVLWAPTRGDAPWAGVGSSVGVFRAASLAGEGLCSCPVFCVNESRKYASI